MTQSIAEKNPIYWYYGSASVAFGIKNNAFSYLLLIYSTQVLGIPGYLAAAALFIAMIWDAVSDLFLGHWSDKTNSRLGRRHPFMYVGMILLPLSFYALFNPVIDLNEDNRWYYLLAAAILIRTAVTLVEVPSVALFQTWSKTMMSGTSGSHFDTLSAGTVVMESTSLIWASGSALSASLAKPAMQSMAWLVH